MEKDTISALNKSFEECAYEQDGVEYWLARELQKLLGYNEWRNFSNAISKAKESYETTGEVVLDTKKEQIAFAQSYFAIQTRRQELLEERIRLMERIEARGKLAVTETELSKNIFEIGVNSRGFAIIRSKGDEALFGGNNTNAMKRKLGIADNKNYPNSDWC